MVLHEAAFVNNHVVHELIAGLSVGRKAGYGCFVPVMIGTKSTLLDSSLRVPPRPLGVVVIGIDRKMEAPSGIEPPITALQAAPFAA